jgi:chromosome segregation ATPase
MPVTQMTQSNITVTKTPCNIDLTALVDAQRNHPDPEVKQAATELVNRAFTIQAEVESLTEQIKLDSIADLERKWDDALKLKSQLEDELATANLRTYEFTAEAGRIAGRSQQSGFRLQEHLALKKTWVEALLSPKDRLAWESKLAELQGAVEASRKESADLQLTVNCHNEDLSVLANKVRTATAEAISLYSKIQRLKGSAEPMMDRSTGLAS